jgi:hypothetical protein
VLRTAGSVCLLLAALPAWGKLGRGVYVNGHNYKVFLSQENYITVSKGDPYSGLFQVYNQADVFKSTYKVCRTYNKVPGESLAVFNNKIYYAYTADTPANPTDTTSCSAPGQNKMSVWVASFDLNPLATERWTSNRALGQVAINYQASSASGAAITVFDNQLYLFADSGIWTSGNGRDWAGPYPTFQDSHWQPLDAVTIYPPNTALYNGPRILIVYGLQTQATSTLYHYNALWGATWNGKWGTGQDYFAVGSPFPSGTLQYIGGTVSLTPGTASFSGWGAKEAAVQLFLKNKIGSTDKVQHIEFTYGTTLGQWRVDPTTYGSSISDLFVFLNSQQECTWFLPAFWALRQQIFINWEQSGDRHAYVEPSDALTPQNRDVPILACGDPGGSETTTTEADPDDPSVLATRQHYWTLVGVILGSPPFAQNGYTAFSDYQNFSNVNFGQDSSSTVEQTNSMSNSLMVSQSTEVHAGLSETNGVGASLDLSYKHTWETANGDTVSKDLKVTRLMGTQASACTEMGRWGWALFMAPTLVYQDWKAYGYDYSPITGTGSPLNVDLHTIKVKDIPDNPDASFAPVVVNFELANPGGPNDQYPGLMSGMQPFSSSLNTRFWLNPGYTWRSDARWQTKLGEGTLPLLQFVPGAGQEVSYSETTQSFESEGETTDVSLTVGLSVKAGTKINGFSQTTKVGYAGSFRTNTKTTTGFGTQVTFGMKMRSCNYSGPNCVSDLSVQPYWLEAGAGAPWVPTAFQSQKPWAITWKLWDMHPIGGMTITSPTCPPPPPTTSRLVASSVDTGIAGGRAGTSLPPDHASGRVVSGMGGGLGGEPYSHYAIEGGRLAWVLNETEERIPMTADDFDPSKGVTVEIQDMSWSLSTGNGTWTRSGDVWTFKPKGSENPVSMKIDFGRATYALHIQRADLSGRVPAGTTIVRLLLTVNDLYMFYADLQHDVDIAWRWSQPAADAKTLHVTSFEGRYDSATQAGKASIAGTLPADLPAFGDVEVNVNEHPHVAQLVGREDFQQAAQSGGVFKYAKEGLILVFDFGNKTWSATFNGKAFHEMLAPRVGMLRTQVSVGGVPRYKAENAVLDYSANLTLSK